MPKSRRSAARTGAAPQATPEPGSEANGGALQAGPAGCSDGDASNAPWGLRDPPSELPCGLQSFIEGGGMKLGGAHAEQIFDLAFCPADASKLVSCSDDDMAAVWRETEHGAWRQAFVLEGHTAGVMRAAWGPGRGCLATASADTTIAIWQLPDHYEEEMALRMRPVQTLRGHPEEVYACEFIRSAAGRRILSASANRLYLWDSETGAKLQEVSGPLGAPLAYPGAAPGPAQGYVFGAEECPDGGGLVASPCSDGALRLWQVSQGGASISPVCKVPMHDGMGSAVAFDPEGRLLLSAARDGSVGLLDVRMWATVATHQAPTGLMATAFLPAGGSNGSGPCCVAAGRDGCLWGIDLHPGGGFRCIYRADRMNYASQLAVAVSHDSRRIAYGGGPVDIPDGSGQPSVLAAANVDAAVGASLSGSRVADDKGGMLFTNNAAQMETQKPTRALIGLWDARSDAGLSDVSDSFSSMAICDQ